MDKDLKESKLFTPYKLGPVTLRNRTIRSAAFESMGKDFGPTQKLKDYHVSVARGGHRHDHSGLCLDQPQRRVVQQPAVAAARDCARAARPNPTPYMPKGLRLAYR